MYVNYMEAGIGPEDLMGGPLETSQATMDSPAHLTSGAKRGSL